MHTPGSKQLIFAGARMPLVYIHNDKLSTIKGDRKSIGYRKSDLDFNFTEHMINIENEMSFYMFSDGLEDQLDENDDRRFGRRRLRNLLKKNARLPFEKQRDMLLQVFDEYKGENEMQDDVTVVGFRF